MEPGSAPALAPSRLRAALVCAGAFALAVATSSGAVGNGFVYDDRFVILDNDVVTDPGRLGEVFTSSWWGSLSSKSSSTGWRPLTILSLHLDHRIAGARAAWYHGVNVALHGAVCALVALLVLSLGAGTRVAIVVSLLFAVHAVHTEAVASIVGRAELLAAASVLGALVVHVRTGRAAAGAGVGAYAAGIGAAVMLHFAGLLSKEIALAMPLMAACADWAAGSPARRVAPLYIGYLVSTALFLGLRVHLFGEISPAADVHRVDNPIVMLSIAERIGAVVLTGGKALVLLLVPAQLSSDYGYAQLPVEAPLASGLFWFGVAGLVVLAAIVVAARRRLPLASAGIAMALAAYLPVANLLVVTHTVLGERTLYLPSLGACIALGAGIDALIGSGREKVRVAAIAALALYAGLLVARTVTRTGDWRSDWTLSSADVRTCPRSIRLMNNYANELMGRGRVREACPILERAVEIDGSVESINANLGLCWLKQGKVEKAIRIFETVLESEPDNSVASRHIGIAREMLEASSGKSGAEGE